MTSTQSPLNPSQAVERIREIIVGRHLERLDQRVSRLETGGVAPLPANDLQVEDRLVASEAQLEALKENIRRLGDTTREQTEVFWTTHREETQRLASQIQQVAASKAESTAPPAVQQLERKLGTWLTDWQSSLHRHLDDRDHRLASSLRNEVAALWENTESHLTRIESRSIDRASVEERFQRIALAARALAECASPTKLEPGPAPIP